MNSWGEYRVNGSRVVVLLCPRCKTDRERLGQELTRVSDPEGPHFDCHDCPREMTNAEIWGATA